MSSARLILLDTRIFVFWTDLDRTKNTLKEPKGFLMFLSITYYYILLFMSLCFMLQLQWY